VISPPLCHKMKVHTKNYDFLITKNLNRERLGPGEENLIVVFSGIAL
jgi:hypothetical protein